MAYKIKLTWTNPNNSLNIENVKIYRSETEMDVNSMPSPLATISGSALEYIDESILENTRYYYIVSYTYLGIEKFTAQLDGIANEVIIFDMATMFNAGEKGAWYDPSDLSTLFQDVAGTIPVVNNGDPVGLMKDKSGNLINATQATSSKRPIYRKGDSRGIVNLLKWSNDISKSPWVISWSTCVTATPDAGGFTRIKGNGCGVYERMQQTNIPTEIDETYTFSYKVKQGTSTRFTVSIWDPTILEIAWGGITYDWVGGVPVKNSSSGIVFNDAITDLGSGIFEIKFSTIAKHASGAVLLYPDRLNTSSDIYVSEVQFEKGPVKTAYQDNAGHLGGIHTDSPGDLHWIEFDGVDDYMDIGTAMNHEEFTMFASILPTSNDGVLLDNRGTAIAKGWYIKGGSVLNGISAWCLVDRNNINERGIFHVGGVPAWDKGLMSFGYESAANSVHASSNGLSYASGVVSGSASIKSTKTGRLGGYTNTTTDPYKGLMYGLVIVDKYVPVEKRDGGNNFMKLAGSVENETFINPVSGFIAMAFAKTLGDNNAYISNATSDASNHERFGSIQARYPMGDPIWTYKSNLSGTADTTTKTGTFPYFSKEWNLFLLVDMAADSYDSQTCTYEFLDENDNPVFALKTYKYGTFTAALQYGANLNSLATTGRTGANNWVHGYITFTDSQVRFTNTKTTNYNNSFTYNCDVTAIRKIRCSVFARTGYLGAGGSNCIAFLFLLPYYGSY